MPQLVLAGATTWALVFRRLSLKEDFSQFGALAFFIFKEKVMNVHTRRERKMEGWDIYSALRSPEATIRDRETDSVAAKDIETILIPPPYDQTTQYFLQRWTEGVFLFLQTVRRGDSTLPPDFLMALVLSKFFHVSNLLPPVPRLTLPFPYLLELATLCLLGKIVSSVTLTQGIPATFVNKASEIGLRKAWAAQPNTFISEVSAPSPPPRKLKGGSGEPVSNYKP